MRRFSPLLSLVVEHDFYAPGRPDGLRFVPDPTTAALLRGPDLVWRAARGELLVAGVDDAWQGDAPSLGLRFLVWSETPGFLAAAEAFVAPGDQMLRFSTERAVDEGGAIWRLHPAPAVTRAERRRTPADAVPPAHLPARRPLFDVVFELAPATVGRRYRIRFEARKVFWTYYVQGVAPATSLAVVDADGEETFAALGAPAADRAVRGLVFRSKRRLALAERSTRRFQLREQLEIGTRVLIRQLPSAGLQLAPIPERRDGALQSEIYVNP
ncbi:MAG: hypothetical protein EA356_06355 [Geminicoccaceae bacterium]|nr:MAG: hypothetical protein EA356_06355 [Geminicoccaceae bacterium]